MVRKMGCGGRTGSERDQKDCKRHPPRSPGPHPRLHPQPPWRPLTARHVHAERAAGGPANPPSSKFPDRTRTSRSHRASIRCASGRSYPLPLPQADAPTQCVRGSEAASNAV